MSLEVRFDSATAGKAVVKSRINGDTVLHLNIVFSRAYGIYRKNRVHGEHSKSLMKPLSNAHSTSTRNPTLKGGNKTV